MIKAIIFDWGGVLSLTGSITDFGNIYAPKFGKDPEEYNKLMIENWEIAKVNKMDSKLFWINLAKFLGTDPETFRKDFSEFHGFNKEILDLAKKLKKNYKLGLLSNQIKDWLEEFIKKHKLKQIFDVIVTSYETGLAKPDITIFREIVKRLNVKPNECVYIDDFETNIPPAKKLGMKTILFRNCEQLKKDLEAFSVKIN